MHVLEPEQNYHDYHAILLRAFEIESDVTGSMGAARGDVVKKNTSCRKFTSAFTEWTSLILTLWKSVLFDDHNSNHLSFNLQRVSQRKD